MNSLIQCSHADFGYENQDAVVDVTMEVNPGDYICIVGENGSGKSTLMKGLLGLLKPTKGTISVSDELKKSGIGYLPQQTAAQKDFPATVGEVVLSGCLSRRGNRPFYSGKEKKLAEKNMERLGIAELGSQCYRDLSGGQQQRVSIGRAIVKNPDILLCDEPTGALDYNTSKEILKLIEEINHKYNNTVLMVTHNDAIKNMADVVIKLKDGEIRKRYENTEKISAAELEW